MNILYYVLICLKYDNNNCQICIFFCAIIQRNITKNMQSQTLYLNLNLTILHKKFIIFHLEYKFTVSTPNNNQSILTAAYESVFLITTYLISLYIYVWM